MKLLAAAEALAHEEHSCENNICPVVLFFTHAIYFVAGGVTLPPPLLLLLLLLFALPPLLLEELLEFEFEFEPPEFPLEAVFEPPPVFGVLGT